MNKESWRNETVAFLALASIENVDYWAMHRLSGECTSFKEVLKNSSEAELERLLKRKISFSGKWEDEKKKLWSKGIEQARELAHRGVMLLFPQQTIFPEKLKNIKDPPRWLFYQGNLDILDFRSAAIVGTRNPSEDGIFLAKYIVTLLAGQGVSTVSGLAMGIDDIVHKESLRYGIPTIGVLGHGFNTEYPKGSGETRNKIVASGGILVSEYLPDQRGSAESFVRRNRLQVALSEAVIPVEWKIKSGTAHTVKFSYKYGKKIINIYLPGTEAERKEIAYSENRYNAISFMVPYQSRQVLNEITAFEEVLDNVTQLGINLSGE